MKTLYTTFVLALFPAFCVAATPLKLNLQQSFADAKSVLAGGGQAKIMLIGDSLENNVSPYFRQNMQNHYGNAGFGYQGFSLWSSPSAGFDGGWTLGAINGDTSPHMSLDGLWAMTSARTTSSFQQADQKVQLHYLAQPGGGSFQPFYWTTGVIATIPTNAPTTELRTWTYTAPANYASNPYWISPMGDGTVTILGQENVTDSPGVRIDKVANGGWGVNNYLQRDGSFDLQVKELNPDLITVWLGQNDQAFNRTSYAAKLRLLGDRIHADVPTAEIVFIGTYDQGSPLLKPLVDAMADVAGERGYGFINLFDTAGDSQFMNQMGYLADGIHFSASGSAYMGNLLYQTFLTDGANLTPEPASLSCLVMVTAVALRRRRRR
jgi:lysophospholipase L1-like esterase